MELLHRIFIWDFNIELIFKFYRFIRPLPLFIVPHGKSLKIRPAFRPLASPLAAQHSPPRWRYHQLASNTYSAWQKKSRNGNKNDILLASSPIQYVPTPLWKSPVWKVWERTRTSCERVRKNCCTLGWVPWIRVYCATGGEKKSPLVQRLLHIRQNREKKHTHKVRQKCFFALMCNGWFTQKPHLLSHFREFFLNSSQHSHATEYDTNTSVDHISMQFHRPWIMPRQFSCYSTCLVS